MIPPPPIPTLFPYTTLFRSSDQRAHQAHSGERHHRDPGRRHSEPAEHAEGRERERQRQQQPERQDRKSTRLNSSHPSISYAVFCLKKKKKKKKTKKQRRAI